jgi:beta-aspartyl-peptidase (threonine type)
MTRERGDIVGIGIAVHGGAYAIPQEEREAHRLGCRRALERGLEVLTRGGASLDAVEAAVAALERDGAFDAGRGSVLNADGNVELDAGIMDGRDLRTGSVAGVMGVPTAIVLARKVLESEYAVLVGNGAKRFAVEHGVETCDPKELVHERERNRWLSAAGTGQERNALMFGDTVGAVAVDSSGNVAAGRATGGTPGKPEGRVGDSPFIGSGLYAENATAAVSTTGHGELMIPLVWAKAAADIVGNGTPPQQAADAALGLLARTGARGGLIIADAYGRIGVAWNTPQMAFAALACGADEISDGPT